MESALSRAFLICGYPRSRTLWLAHFFNLPYVCVCSHEATEYAASSEEFWANAEGICARLERPVYGNSDSAQIFILPALLERRPMTSVVWIDRPIEEVIESMHRCGLSSEPNNWAPTLIAYRQRYQDLFDSVIPYDSLNEVGTIRALWEELLGPEVPFVEGWWNRMKDQRIAYSIPDNPPHPKSNEKFSQFLMLEMERLAWPMQRSSEP
jgi:hypothetical protein